MMNRSGGAARRPSILMLAPEPVLQPRGTPMSVYHRLRALSALGYAVDLVTYPLGEAIDIPHVRVLRVWRPWGLRRIKIGPSAPKLLLDLFLAVVALGCVLRRRYDAIHSHEEAVFIAAAYAALFRLPHLYDMHSSLPQQLSNWRQWYATPASRLAASMERWAIRRSDVLITICPALTDCVRAIDPTKPQVTIENAATFDADAGPDAATALRARYGVGSAPLVVYTGNFEPYQGVELLLESFALAHARLPQATLMIVGGGAADGEPVRRRVRQLGIESAVVLTGSVPPEAVPGFLAAADVLASPRVSGTNTPLKLYAYLKAAKPVVATDLPTHTQLLSQENAILASPEPAAFAAGLVTALTDRARGAQAARGAKALADARLTDAVYRERVAQAYRLLLPTHVSPCAASAA